jgi:cysteine desulfurase/selenocysteine lyase
MLNVRDDFPFLERLVNDRPLAYLDNAATTQKPRHVMVRTASTSSATRSRRTDRFGS